MEYVACDGEHGNRFRGHRDAEHAMASRTSAEHGGGREVIGDGVGDLHTGDVTMSSAGDPEHPRLRDSNTEEEGRGAEVEVTEEELLECYT